MLHNWLGLRVPDELVARVADQSKRNLRRALLMLETCRVQQCVIFWSLWNPYEHGSWCRSHFSADQEVPLCDWELYIQETANIALKDQSPAKYECWSLKSVTHIMHTRLLEVRGRLYELLTHCIPPEVVLKVRCEFHVSTKLSKIIQELARELIESLDTKLKVEVTRHAAEYEHRMQVYRISSNALKNEINENSLGPNQYSTWKPLWQNLWAYTNDSLMIWISSRDLP